MKRLAFLGAALMVFSLTSCKKDRTCKCDNYSYVINGTKGKAKTVCEDKGIIIKDEDGNEQESSDCTLE
ncbi:MAG: hypothetical protein ACPGD5_04670 [Salibacteraceae bacterium]